MRNFDDVARRTIVNNKAESSACCLASEYVSRIYQSLFNLVQYTARAGATRSRRRSRHDRHLP